MAMAFYIGIVFLMLAGGLIAAVFIDPLFLLYLLPFVGICIWHHYHSKRTSEVTE